MSDKQARALHRQCQSCPPRRRFRCDRGVDDNDWNASEDDALEESCSPPRYVIPVRFCVLLLLLLLRNVSAWNDNR